MGIAEALVNLFHGSVRGGAKALTLRENFSGGGSPAAAIALSDGSAGRGPGPAGRPESLEEA